MARRNLYTPELSALVCERIAGGESLRTISKSEDMPCAAAVYNWLTKYPEFVEQYAQAREQQTVALAEEILDIADDGSNDWMEDHHRDNEGWRENGEAMARSRLRVDTRKWLLSKLAPKKYGDKVMNEHTGAGGGALEVRLIREYIGAAGTDRPG